MIIYHNNRCSVSREALSLLEKENCTVEIREYLANPPSKKEIKDLLKKLGCKAIDVVRKKESLFIETYKDKKITNNEWINILSEHPILIERPIIISDDKAVIGRPPSLIVEFAKKG